MVTDTHTQTVKPSGEVKNIMPFGIMIQIRGPGGRAEDSRSEGPGIKSRNWAKFQSCGETLK